MASKLSSVPSWKQEIRSLDGYTRYNNNIFNERDDSLVFLRCDKFSKARFANNKQVLISLQQLGVNPVIHEFLGHYRKLVCIIRVVS